MTPGARIGPYEIVSALGAGGMGEVWKARDTRLNRVVAIKRLKGEHGARFQREAQAIAALNHPNICTLHDVGPDYLVMEFVDGKPVAGPLPADDAVRLAIQIAGALEEAHGRGIVHHDLRPANILITAKGTAKLLDFGIATLMTDPGTDVTRTFESTAIGSPAYMSPEQARGEALDQRSDVFSFGAVLYELLSGHRPFDGASSVEVLTAVLRDEPPPLRTSPEIGRIVTRCLSKIPAQRFQTMADVKAALEQLSTKSAAPRPSIAVLPFANMSSDKEQEFFSDGLAEEIINALAQIPDLDVTARTSAFAFRGAAQNIRAIAETLNVRTILEGSVRRSGNRIRVTAQLINAEDGYHLWSQRYDRELADVFAVQDEIAAAIAAALQVRLVGRSAAVERRVPNLAAYEAFLKGQIGRASCRERV